MPKRTPWPQADPDTPAVARLWNHWLGGVDNYAADRELAADLEAIAPGLARMPAISRRFVSDAVTAAAQGGIGQLLDLGSGYLTGTAIHHFARAVNPAARAAYVDADQDPADYNRYVSLDEQKLEGVTAVWADLRDPAAVLVNADVREVIDLSEPVCVIMAAVLHFSSPGEAARIVAGYMERLAPGSTVVITTVHVSLPHLWELIRKEWRAGTGTDLWNYPAAELGAVLGSLEPVTAAGLVPGPRSLVHVNGAVGRKT